MNIIQIQDDLKNFSEQQLIKEMQQPSGNAPQFLVLSELTRRQKMKQDYQKRMNQSGTTVAQDAINGAGVPQGGLASMGQQLAPHSAVAQNTGAQPMGMPVQPAPPQPVGMADGGQVDDTLAEAQRRGLFAIKRLLKLPYEPPYRMTSPAGVGDPNYGTNRGGEYDDPGMVGGPQRRYAQLRPTLRTPEEPPPYQPSWMSQDTSNNMEDGQGDVAPRWMYEGTNRAAPINHLNSYDSNPDGGFSPAGGLGIEGMLPTGPSEDASPGLPGPYEGAPDMARRTFPQVDVRDSVHGLQDQVQRDELMRRMLATEPGQGTVFEGKDRMLATEPPNYPSQFEGWSPGMIEAYARGKLGPVTPPSPDPHAARAEANLPSSAWIGEDAMPRQGWGSMKEWFGGGSDTETPVPTPETDPNTARHAEDANAVADAQAAAATASSSGAGGAGGSGGGGSGGGGGSAAAGLMSSLQKQMIQDKWMALALAGAQLMTSTNPSFGGAVGEAFQTGLGALNGYRDNWRGQEMLALRAKYGGRGGGGSGGSSSSADVPEWMKGMYDNLFKYDTDLTAQIGEIDDMIYSRKRETDMGIEDLTDEDISMLMKKRDRLANELAGTRQYLPFRQDLAANDSAYAE